MLSDMKIIEESNNENNNENYITAYYTRKIILYMKYIYSSRLH